MAKSSIEITDSAYLIKLNKAEFEYPLVRKLLNKLLSGSLQQEAGGFQEDDVSSKYSLELGDRFDCLADK